MAGMENEATFVAPEGVYTVTDELKPSWVQNHTVATGPAIFPTHLAQALVRFPAPPKQGPAQGLANLLAAGKDLRRERTALHKPSPSGDADSVSSSDSPDDADPPSSTTQDHPQEPHGLFAPASAAAGKKRGPARPKHNIRTTSSTFITRIQTAEGLSKSLQAKQGDVTFMFYNVSKSFVWVEAGSKAKEPLSRITFSAHPTCHDVNAYTATSDHLDVVIGFNTGDLVWLDPMTSRYCRLNKQGCISNSPCTAVRWVPSSPTLFLASHADGTIVVYDKERDDGTFTPQEPTARPPDAPDDAPPHTHKLDWDPKDSIFVTMPPWHPVTSGGSLSSHGKPDKEKTAKNPVSHWRVSKRGIVDFVFSPDVKYVGAISEDGCLRVIDTLNEQLVDCYASYFGALTCIAWSPDGRYIVTGGQDDLLTIFSPWEQRVVARCQGHSSFVSAVAFDDLRCDGRTYRFGSVGEDNKLILWDFSSGALHRPKFQASHHPRVSMSSTISLALRRDKSAQFLPPASAEGASSPRFHPAPSRNEIAVVQPVLIKNMENDILSAIAFLPRCILTATKAGHIKLWVRPLALKPRSTRMVDVHHLIS